MFDDYGVDYAALDAERDERIEWLHDRMHWLTLRELDAVMEQESFPGLFAKHIDLETFAQAERKRSERLVECKAIVYGLSVPARLDLVSGACYVTGEKGAERIGLEGPAQFTFVTKGTTASAFLEDGTATLLSSRDVRYVVEALEKAKAIAAMPGITATA